MASAENSIPVKQLTRKSKMVDPKASSEDTVQAEIVSERPVTFLHQWLSLWLCDLVPSSSSVRCTARLS
jgi:hypothetical protein